MLTCGGDHIPHGTRAEALQVVPTLVVPGALTLSKQSFGANGACTQGSGQPSGQVLAERWARGHCPLPRLGLLSCWSPEDTPPHPTTHPLVGLEPQGPG